MMFLFPSVWTHTNNHTDYEHQLYIKREVHESISSRHSTLPSQYKRFIWRKSRSVPVIEIPSCFLEIAWLTGSSVDWWGYANALCWKCMIELMSYGSLWVVESNSKSNITSKPTCNSPKHVIQNTHACNNYSTAYQNIIKIATDHCREKFRIWSWYMSWGSNDNYKWSISLAMEHEGL